MIGFCGLLLVFDMAVINAWRCCPILFSKILGICKFLPACGLWTPYSLQRHLKTCKQYTHFFKILFLQISRFRNSSTLHFLGREVSNNPDGPCLEIWERSGGGIIVNIVFGGSKTIFVNDRFDKKRKNGMVESQKTFEIMTYLFDNLKT